MQYLNNIEINVLKKDLKNMSWGTAHLSTSKSKSIKFDSLPVDTAEIETGMTAKSAQEPGKQTAKTWFGFGEIEKNLAKLSIPIFTYRSSS